MNNQMNNQRRKKSISEAVLSKIKEGRVEMRPKMYFVLRIVLLVLSVIVLTLFIFFLVSFILFALRTSGVWFLPGFGLPGIRIFFTSLPWLLILLAVLLIAVLEILAKYFAFVYRKPVFYSIVAIIIVVLLGSFVVYKTRVHSNLFLQIQKRDLPIVGRIYRDYGMAKFRDVHLGVVSGITDTSFLIEKRDGEVLIVIVDSSVKLRFAKDIKEDDVVIVLGRQNDGTVQAFDVRKINDEFNMLPRPRIDMYPRRQFNPFR